MRSLINHYFVMINTFAGKRLQTSIFHHIHTAIDFLAELHHHSADIHKRQIVAIRICNQQIDVAIWCFFPTRTGAEQICSLYGLRLQKLLNLRNNMSYFCTWHNLTIFRFRPQRYENYLNCANNLPDYFRFSAFCYHHASSTISFLHNRSPSSFHSSPTLHRALIGLALIPYQMITTRYP